jgi:hypothetical protein
MIAAVSPGVAVGVWAIQPVGDMPLKARHKAGARSSRFGATRQTVCLLFRTARDANEKERCLMAANASDELQPRARAALGNSPFYELRELQVERHGDALSLSGRVSSVYHKQLAQEVVRSVCAGVKRLNSICVEVAEKG